MKSNIDSFYATLKYDPKTDKFTTPGGEVFDGLAQAKEAFYAQGMTSGMRMHLTLTKVAQSEQGHARDRNRHPVTSEAGQSSLSN